VTLGAAAQLYFGGNTSPNADARASAEALNTNSTLQMLFLDCHYSIWRREGHRVCEDVGRQPRAD